MRTITVPAYFDGERILLDTPVEIEPDARLLVTILPRLSEEREAWLRLSGQALNSAYGDDEPEYGPDSIQEINPDYAGG